MAQIMIDSKDNIMNLNVTEEFAVMVKELIWDNHKKKHSNKGVSEK